MRAIFISPGQNPQINDWQYRQALKAIHILFTLIKAAWIEQIDWLFLEQASYTLKENHATIARECSDASMHEHIERTLATKHENFDDIKKKHEAALTRMIYEIRRRAYSIRTEEAYLKWAVRFLAAYGNDEVQSISAKEVIHFLEYLAVKRHVSASTQNQALNALIFFFEHGLNAPLDELESFTRAKKPKQLPVVLTQNEVNKLLGQLQEIPWLMTSLLYGTGMRLMECVRLRVQDIDFNYQQIMIRCGKG